MAIEKKVKISMKNGTEKFLADLTSADLDNVKLEARKEGKHAGKSYLSLKSEVVAETPTHKTERRIFKWTVMDKVAMYNVTYGKTLAIFSKEIGDVPAYEYAIGNYLIEQDKVNNGISTGLDKESKALGKQASKLPDAGKKELEALLAKYNLKESDVKANIKKAGFGK